MKRVVVLLAAATLIFSATAIHYARALQQQQARNQQVGIDPPRPPRGADPASLAANAGGVESQGTPVMVGSEASNPPARDAAAMASARARLDQLHDPVRRTGRAREIADNYRGAWQTVARHIGLSAAQIDELVAQLAGRTLARQQRRLECQLEPGCDVRAMNAAAGTSLQQDQAELLGPEMHARYRAYMDAAPERALVTSLHWRLGAGNSLSEAKTAALNVALAEERQRFIAATGEQRPRGAEYQQRLLERASTLLNAAQLAEFKLMQEETLETSERIEKERQIRDTARKAASHGP